MVNQPAFQDEMLDNHCWGCGDANPHGLRIKSYWSGNEAVCIWHPKEYHLAGGKPVLNGGIIATLLDCHCICTAIAAAYRAEGRGIHTRPEISYATASLTVSYLRPTPLDRPVILRARIKEVKPEKTVLACTLFSEEEECARAEVVTVRVPPEWGERS